ncbi:lipid A deacylase LpxR family protein [Microbulbifer aggregans]|uniref:lipid A deacylase LpxR family protein n=1 Tax=Microbulbifer aggregans TaxID=1769779 RepID=UPI001CFE5EAF|nr:lipid A deacylase LpxR family protein [Microbulbifer aggregans]
MDKNAWKALLRLPLQVLSLAVVCCVPALAGTLSIQVENDSFDGASDAYYTQGMQLGYSPDSAPEWSRWLLPWTDDGRELHAQYFLGQAIFTPYEIERPELILDDRPYAGWLYLGMSVTSAQLRPESHLKVIDRLDVSAGIVGPSSGAQRVQRWAHDLVRAYKVNGWDNQLHDEPALLVSCGRKWAYINSIGESALDWELSGNLGGSLGNVSTQVAAGVGMRFGRDLYASASLDGLPPLTQAPGLAGGTLDLGWYFFTDWQQRYIARDIFLDGNNFKDSHSVEKETSVGDWRFGFGFATGRFTWSAYHVRRSREFVGQYENVNFSGLGVMATF